MKRREDLVLLNDARERVIVQLSDAFARDLVGLDELEGRLTLAHRAECVSDIECVVSDLVATPPSTEVARLSSSGTASEHAGIAAVFGGVERGGPWLVPRYVQMTAVFGGMILDLREALFLPGVTEIHVVAVMGGAQLIVPPGLSVEVSGTAILGGFAYLDRMPVRHDPKRPLLRVHGRAVLGGVAVETRLPGESETDAHRRRRLGRPALARCE